MKPAQEGLLTTATMRNLDVLSKRLWNAAGKDVCFRAIHDLQDQAKRVEELERELAEAHEWADTAQDCMKPAQEETPRTDAEILRILPGVQIENSPLEIVRPDFARQLERELAEARASAATASMRQQASAWEAVWNAIVATGETARSGGYNGLTAALNAIHALQSRAEQAERELSLERAKSPPLTRDDTIRELELAVQREHLRAEQAERELETAGDEAQYALDLQRERNDLAEAREQVEVGLQISGSFFSALKRLKLPAINVANPGQHIIDLIHERDEAYERAARLRIVGNQMSNLCYNGRQQTSIPENYRNRMRDLQLQWDEAVDAIRALSKPQDTSGGKDG